MESRIIQGLKTPDDTIYFVRETFKIQSELLDYLTDLDEKDKLRAISELRELEDYIQQINEDIEKEVQEELALGDEESSESSVKKTEPPFGLPFDFSKLINAFDYSEIEEFRKSFHLERDSKIDEFDRQKIDESKINNYIKEYLIAKKLLVQDFQKKLKSIDALLKKLLSEKYSLNTEEKIFVIIDSLRILKTITTISLNYKVERWDSLQRTYSIFKKIYDHFLKQIMTGENIFNQLEDISPLFDEIPSEKDDFYKKYLKSGPLLIPKKNISTEQILLAIELKFWEYQKKLFELFSIDENLIFKNIPPYEKIKQRFGHEIDSLFSEAIEKVLAENPFSEYGDVAKWRFDFIIHDEFRNVILRDFAELKNVLSAGCHKSALILIGSMLEAILFDLFYENDNVIRQKFEEKYPKKKFLYSHSRFQWLTEAAKELGIINEDLKKICELIWSLRHNVHTMKEIEGLKVTKEQVDAVVALMSTVIRNLSKNVHKYIEIIQTQFSGLDIDVENIVKD